jgi:hypothetical protein
MVSSQQSAAPESGETDADTRSNEDGGRALTTTYHEIVDGFVVAISGAGGRSVDQLRAMYDRQQVADSGRNRTCGAS